MKIEFPRNFINNNCILGFLSEAKILFHTEQKFVLDVVYDCSKIKRMSILGVLLFYKAVDYAYRNNCFRNPTIKGNVLFLESAWAHYGFLEYLKAYIESKLGTQINEYLKFEIQDTFVIAPQPLSRKEHKRVNEILQKEFTPILNKFYKDDSKIVDMIFGCVSEIIGNFWEHAADNNSSLLVAEGNREYIEISCADTGRGIISTMRSSKRYKASSTSEYLLRKALTRGVTSKPLSNHMGYGLWIINQIATLTKGKFFVYSEGVYYGNDAGKEFIKECDFWKGTIVYLKLPLDNPVSASQIIEKELVKGESDLLLNFG